MSPESLEALKQAPAVPGVLEVVSRRWSPRAFSDKTISRDNLMRLFEAARWAASSTNEQPWRFFLGVRGDSTYQKIFDSLVEFNQTWAGAAPVLVLSVAKSTFTQNGNPNRFALYDTGAATATLALQAIALGLHAHSMGGFNPEKARAAFGVPHDYEIGAVTAIGYLGDPEALSEKLRGRELEPRTRKPLNEIVFTEWEKPAQL